MNNNIRRSPCVGICTYDEETELCIGCFRNYAEIGQWGQLPVEEQQRIMREELPKREEQHAAQFELRYS